MVSATTVLPPVPLTIAVRSAAQSMSAVNPVAVRGVKVTLNDALRSHITV